MIGTSLSHFKITAKLGEGGMGEVYRAQDSKLGREVAIKVLPEAVASDPERLARFQREAKVLASLNHPNIAGIHQVEEAEGVHFLVMEIVEGEDLYERMASGSIPVEQALPIASQIAQALEAAHEKGVIHRDLKPANVKVTPDGQVKVLDFGLAKALDPAAESGTDISASPAALSLSPTLTQQMTSAGIILGTAAYMSPEQAKGETVDKRADIWSFGLVVFEMLTGRKLFAADSVAETLAGVIKTDIDFSKLPSDLPSEITRLLRRCLDRDAKNRLHDIADARIVIDDVLAGRVEDTPMPGTGTDSAAASIWKTTLPFAVGALGLAFGLLWMWQPWASGTAAQPEESVYEFEVLPPKDSVMVPGVAISPDGKTIAFAAKAANGRRELWLRDLDSLEARKVSGSDGARYPFWAPDSRQIGFFARGDLKVTDLIGSNPRSLTAVGSETFERGATWGANGDILYAPYFSGGIFRIASDGGDPELFTDVEAGGDIGTHRFPSFLPDGRHFVFYGSSGSGTEPGILLVGDLETGETKTLGPSNSMAVFAEPDFLLHARGKNLVAQRIDLETFEFVGPPEVLEVELPGSVSVSGHRTLDQARGILVHRLDTLSFTKLVWVDRSGTQIGDVLGDQEAWQYAPRLSPDGKWLAAGAFESTASTVSIMLHDLDRGIATPFQPTDNDQQTPAWSPTGDRLAYELIRSAGDFVLCVGSVAHPEEKQEIFVSEFHPAIEFFTPDGQSVVFSQANAKGLAEMWLLSLEKGSLPVPFMPGLGSRGSASLSPDGGWVAYGSAESGQFEVYVSHFAGDGSSTRISSQGGSQPLWSQDGTELFYLNAVGEIVSVPVTPGNPPTFGAEQPLFQARLEEASDRQYDVAADGERFILNQQNTIDTTPIIVTTDWRRLLKD